jgi:hypothetical protein
LYVPAFVLPGPAARGRIGPVNDQTKQRAQQDIEPDPVIEAFKRDVDRTLLRENLKLTPQQRLDKLEEMQRFVEELRLGLRKGASHP